MSMLQNYMKIRLPVFGFVQFVVELVFVIRKDELHNVGAYIIGEIPSILVQQPINDRDSDDVIESFEFAQYERPVSPRTSQGDVKMVASLLRLEPARAISYTHN